MKSDSAAWGAMEKRGGHWSASVWTPTARNVSIEIKGRIYPARNDQNGTFTAQFPGEAGQPYIWSVDGMPFVDPAARAVDTAHGPARLKKPVLRKHTSPRRDWSEAVILEIHIGTFTPEGSFQAAIKRMAGLADLGITAIEIMPVVAFNGARGWGYDGVLPFAVHSAYGSAQDLADLVDAIHAAGMLAILDVVYNHFGPEGCSLGTLAPPFFDASRSTPWGPGIDYSHAPVRQFFIQNAMMWVQEFGFDGLRLDATHQINDPSEEHLIDEIARTLRAAVPDRPIHLIAEDERNLPDARDRGVITANWNDDYHHAVHCLLTGEEEGYYASFAADPIADLARAMADGHVEQGQDRAGATTARGAPSAHLPVTAFVNANQTHDQIGNRAAGERLITLAGADRMRIVHAMLLTAPAIPMLFMGEEEGARAPFQFFADFTGDLADAVRKGRAAEFAEFGQFAGTVPDPLLVETFHASRPYAARADDADDWLALTRICLHWRAEQLVPLLKSGRAAAALVTPTGRASLRARWAFQAGTLHMVAHLGAVQDAPFELSEPGLVFGAATSPLYLAVKVTPR